MVILKSFGHHNPATLVRAGLQTRLTSEEERQHRQSALESFSVPTATPIHSVIAAGRALLQSPNDNCHRLPLSADNRPCLHPDRLLISFAVPCSPVLPAKTCSPPRHHQLPLVVIGETVRRTRRASAASPAVRAARKRKHPRRPVLPAKACSPPIHHPPLQAAEALLAARVPPGKDMAVSRQWCVK
jgi:hypothetical protein